ncbi:MAG: hypothetical protein J3K34DRAFT_220698 [Monoraphidium minutum]|nr:MAG: hypothetical protein J3K34DRAFT_220698 [Monoraphidium minutum]
MHQGRPHSRAVGGCIPRERAPHGWAEGPRWCWRLGFRAAPAAARGGPARAERPPLEAVRADGGAPRGAPRRVRRRVLSKERTRDGRGQHSRQTCCPTKAGPCAERAIPRRPQAKNGRGGPGARRAAHRVIACAGPCSQRAPRPPKQARTARQPAVCRRLGARVVSQAVPS